MDLRTIQTMCLTRLCAVVNAHHPEGFPEVFCFRQGTQVSVVVEGVSEVTLEAQFRTFAWYRFSHNYAGTPGNLTAALERPEGWLAIVEDGESPLVSFDLFLYQLNQPHGAFLLTFMGEPS